MRWRATEQLKLVALTLNQACSTTTPSLMNFSACTVTPVVHNNIPEGTAPVMESPILNASLLLRPARPVHEIRAHDSGVTIDDINRIPECHAPFLDYPKDARRELNYLPVAEWLRDSLLKLHFSHSVFNR